MRRGLAVLVFVLVLVLAPGLRAQEADDDEKPPASSDPCVNLASLRGLAGMREMIDARTPEGNWHIRAGAYFQGSSESIGTDGGVRSFTRDRFELTPWIGASFLGHLDVGFHWPFPEVEHTQSKIHDVTAPTLDPWPSVQKDDLFGGGGNFSFAAKGGWTLGIFSIVAYAIGQTNTGSRHMTHKEDSFGEVGGASTIAVAAGQLCFHLNLGARHLETRHHGWGFRYRPGMSYVAVPSPSVRIRSFLYADGVENEGSPGSDVRLGAGVQIELAERVQLEVSGDGRLYAGSLVGPFSDDGTYAVAFNAGFVY